MQNEKKEFSTGKKIKFVLFTTVFFIIAIVLAGELITRLCNTYDTQQYSDKSQIDEILGWKPKANYQARYQMVEFGEDARKYDVSYTTSEHGFRQWGDVNSSKHKILFVGDSYVQSVEVSDEKTFYHIIGDSLDIEVFAFGQAGYGTLQQKIILDQYVGIINPDLILLQTCDNDLIDNHAPLEYNSSYKVGLRRPYYDKKGNISYHKAMPRWQEIIDKFKFLGVLRKKIMNTVADKDAKSSQVLMAELGEDYIPYKESLEITKKVLEDIKSSLGETSIVAWSASAYEPQLTAFETMSLAAGIPFEAHMGKRIQEYKWGGKNVLTQDGYHWSELGQEKIAEMLIKTISSYHENN